MFEIKAVEVWPFFLCLAAQAKIRKVSGRTRRCRQSRQGFGRR